MRSLLAISIVLLLALPATAQTPADQQFTFAVRLMREGQADLATDAFEAFVRDYEADRRAADAHYYLALLNRRAGKVDAALKHLESVKRPMYVKDAAVRLIRGQLQLESGDAKAALAEFKAIKPDDLTDNDSRATWHYLTGVAYRKTGDNDAAAKQFALASEAESSVRGRAMLELGKARTAMKQYPQALEALTDVPETDVPAEVKAEARRLAGEIAFELKQYEQSAALFQTVLDKHGQSGEAPAARIGLLRALLAAGRDEQVVANHKKLADAMPADVVGEGWYLRAAAHVRLKQYDQAIAALEQFSRRTKSDHPLGDRATYLAGLCLYHTDPAKYEAWYVATKPTGRQLAYLRAAAAAQRERYDDAITFLTPLIDPQGEDYAKRALLERANLYEKTKRPQQAAADYALYAERYGKDAQASDASRRAIDLAFAAGEHKQVVDRATAWLSNAPAEQKAPVQLKLAASLIKLNQPDRADAVLNGLLKSKPDESTKALAEFYRGLLLAGKKDKTDQAIAALNAALDGSLPEGQQTEAIALIARLHRLAGHDDKAIAAYEKLRKRATADSFDPATAGWVGRGLYESGNYEAALPWLEVATVHADATDESRAAAMFYTARSLQALERWNEAITAYQSLLGRTTAFGQQGRLGLAQSLVGSGDVESAMEEYNGLINVRATAVAATALYESALLHRATGDRLAAAGYDEPADKQYAEARRRLNRLLILHDVPQLGTLPVKARIALGRIEQQTGRTDLARKRFTEAAEQTNHPAWATIGKAELALLDGRRAEAIKLLGQVDKQATEAKADADERLAELR